MDALREARDKLSSRISDPKVRFVPGLADDLKSIANAFAELERRTSMLAAVVLRKHYWPGSPIQKSEVDGLTAMGQDAETIARIASHGDTCCCELCLPIG